MSGYWLNHAFNDLRHPEARQRLTQGLAAYLDDYPLSDEEKQMVKDGDWAGCVDAGASVYTLTKLLAPTGLNLLQMGAQMRGQSMEEFAEFLRDQNERSSEFALLEQGVSSRG